MKKISIIHLIIISVVLSACGTSPSGSRFSSDQPDWINGVSKKYPDRNFLIGRGQGNTMDLAKDRARSNLAKVFSVAISDESTDIQRFSQIQQDEESKKSSELTISQSITTSTDKVLEGIQIADLWQNPKTQEFFALAVIKRSQASARLNQDINALDAGTKKYISNARTEKDLLRQIAYASRAVDSQRERQEIQQMLRIVDTSGRGSPAKYKLTNLITDRDKLLNKIKITPHADSSTFKDEITTSLSGALSAAGFTPETGPNPDYVLEASLKVDDTGLRDGWYWQKGVLEIKFSEANTELVRGTKLWHLKASAQDKSTATNRLLKKVDSLLKEQLGPALIKFALPD